MKLISKINRMYFIYGLIIFFLSDCIIIVLGDYLMLTEIDQELQLEASEIGKLIGENHYFHDVYPTDIANQIEGIHQPKHFFKDTLIYDEVQKEEVPFRQYTEIKKINGDYFRITTRHMLLEFNDLAAMFATFISAVLLFLFLFMFIFTSRINVVIWRGFNKNIDELKKYSFDTGQELHLKLTGITEFDFLNKTLKEMSLRLKRDYEDSKEFSANVAHELKTPLAIIRNKCENLFSKMDLDEETVQEVRDIYVSSCRLSEIVKALLLLAKIEKGLFNNLENISLNGIVQQKLKDLKEVLDYNRLCVEVKESAKCEVLIDARLANLWVQNILNNAIKYSPKDQKIEIHLSEDLFSVSNHGEATLQHPDLVFERFYKESFHQNSTGVGLALVKKITDLHDVTPRYEFTNSRHIFSFQKKSQME